MADRPNSFQIDSYLTGLSLITAIPPVAGQQWIQLKVRVGALAHLVNGSSGINFAINGFPFGGATLAPIELHGAATLSIVSIGASCEITAVRGMVV